MTHLIRRCSTHCGFRSVWECYRGFLHEVGCWVTEVTDRDFCPRCVKKPGWTFTRSPWRGRAAGHPCCSNVQKETRCSNTHQGRFPSGLISSAYFGKATWWVRAHSKHVWRSLLELWSASSFDSVHLSMKRMTVVLGGCSFSSYYFMCSLLG